MRWIALLSLAFTSSCVISKGTLDGPDGELPVDAFTEFDAPSDAPHIDARLDAFALDTPSLIDAPTFDTPSLTDTPTFDTPVPNADVFAEPDVFTPPDAFVVPDAFTPPDVGRDAFVCSGYIVYAQCVTGLRLWLDAGDLRLLEGVTVDRWVNRASGSPTGDAVRPGGEMPVTYTVTTGAAVMFGAGRLRTENDISVNRSTHFEVFIAATSRSTANGYIFETAGSTTPRISAHLPWTDTTTPTAYFDIPFIDTATRIQAAPFTPQAVWHAYRGTSGSALYVNNAAIPTSGTLTMRDSSQQLWIGGNNANTARNQINLHELIIFNEPISDSARAAIRSAMQMRWFPGL